MEIECEMCKNNEEAMIIRALRNVKTFWSNDQRRFKKVV